MAVGSRHIVVRDYKRTLVRVIEGLGDRADLVARVLRALLEHSVKWAGPNQVTGIVSKHDLRAAAGEAAVVEFIRLAGLAQHE